ncbi:hypothetical protein ACLOJK_030819 [Asimina triloba]
MIGTYRRRHKHMDPPIDGADGVKTTLKGVLLSSQWPNFPSATSLLFFLKLQTRGGGNLQRENGQLPRKFSRLVAFVQDSSPSNSPVRNKRTHHGEPSVDFASKLQETDRNLEDASVEDASVDLSGESPMSNVRKSKASKIRKDRENDDLEEGDGLEGEAADEEILEKPTEPQVSSRLPLVFPEKIQRLKALVECDGDSIDLSGDVGVVGRISFSNAPSGNSDVLFDLKEAVMNDFIQLKPHSNVYEAETMIEGTLDGFSFDSDEEGDKIPKPSARQSNQNNEDEDATDVKANGKGTSKKRAKPVGKPAKTGGRKSQAPKKTKKSKK